jgi:hypothetical protein
MGDHVEGLLDSFKFKPVRYHKVNMDFSRGYQVNRLLCAIVLPSDVY